MENQEIFLFGFHMYSQASKLVYFFLKNMNNMFKI